MSRSTQSWYQDVGALVGFLSFFAGAVLWSLLALAGHRFVPRPSRRTSAAVGCVHLVATLCAILALAIVAGFHILPTSMCVLLSVMHALVGAPFPALCFSDRFALLFYHSYWRRDDHHRLPGSSDDARRSSDLYAVSDDETDKKPSPPRTTQHSADDEQGTELSPAAPHPAEAPTDETRSHGSSSDDNSLVGDVTDAAQSSSTTSERLRKAIRATPRPHLLRVLGFDALCIVTCYLTLANMCMCSSPFAISTWMSRATSGRVCPLDGVCHTYGIVGAHCSMPVVVSHFVASSAATQPTAATLEWSRVPPGRVGGDDNGRIVAGRRDDVNAGSPIGRSSQDLDGRLVTDRPIHEDWRTVAQFSPFGLRCGEHYNMTITFYRNSQRLASRIVTLHTLPTGATEDVILAGGGDLESSELGYGLLAALARRAVNPDIVYVGGDIAYANNGRYCYRRWDETLAAMAGITRADGSKPLLMTVVGNHEAGGYLQSDNDSRAARRRAYAHYTTYFPSSDFLSDFALYPESMLPGTKPHPRIATTTASAVPWSHSRSLQSFASTSAWRGDDTMTFYRALIGTTAWVALDSDVMLTTASQIAMLNETLARWAELRDAGSGGITKLVLTYHCPGLPTLRDTDDKRAVAVRRDFFPLMRQYGVALVLENHDHVYKRSYRIATADESGNGQTAGRGEGTLFVGDGSLGVAKVRHNIKVRWWHDRVVNVNQGYVVRITPEGSMHFHVLTPRDGVDPANGLSDVDTFEA